MEQGNQLQEMQREISTLMTYSPITQSSENLTTVDIFKLDDISEGLPSISDITINLVRRELQEIKQMSDQTIPKLQTINIMKRSLREFYNRETMHLFEFFNSNISSIEGINVTMVLMKRFGRPDYNPKAVKIKDLIFNKSSTKNLDDINAKLRKCISKDLSGCAEQWHILVDIWKSAVTNTLKAQTLLESRIITFQAVQKKITNILTLPINDSYSPILEATENYLKKVFQDNQLEEAYKDFIENSKTVYILHDFINAFRQLVNAQTEPICGVCLTEAVSFVTIPCGHTFCQTCSQRQTLTCYICRSNVKERMKIYFS
jgi:hypothetical protein